MAERIGLTNNVTLEWMELAANCRISGKTQEEAYPILNEKIAESIRSPGNQKRIRVSLFNMWYRPEDWFLDYNLSDINSDYTSGWISSNTELRKNHYYLKYNKVPLGAENYCDVEYRVYRKMKEKKIDCFFARIDKINIGERVLYIQERAEALSDFDESLEELYPDVKVHNWSKKAAERAEKNGITIRAVWLELAAKTYGRKKVKRLFTP